MGFMCGAAVLALAACQNSEPAEPEDAAMTEAEMPAPTADTVEPVPAEGEADAGAEGEAGADAAAEDDLDGTGNPIGPGAT